MSAESFEAPSLEHLAELLPNYDFEAFIAQGGMGAVYKARQRSLDRDVAIKILPRELGADPEFHQSFETEAKAMARLNHPNLIGVYDFGDVEGMPYIVMEYVNGKSLFHSAYNTAIEPVQAVTIVKGICDGLAHAHENGVIHRDIKPANILLTPKAEPKIGDFGLARPAGADSSGIVMGTPGYAAPEITRHPDHADRRSDLFALGVVLYELLIGRCPPYDYQPPPSTVVGCDPALDRICEKAMHPVADLRYPSAEAMSAALDEWLRKAAAGPAQQPVAGGRRMRRVSSSAPVPYETADSGSGGMVKGLVMLAAAIVIVAVGWGKYKDHEAAKAAALQAAVEASKAKTTDQPAKTAAAKPAKSALDPAKPEPARPAESPLQSLARLKKDLAAGKRDQLPAGSIAINGSDILIVPTPMTWHAAATFAEDHGGHLFVVGSDKDLDQVSALVPAGESGADPGVWLGVGKVGKEAWISVDGSEWAATSAPVGKGTYAVLDGSGVVKARESADRYPFIIQWEKDGSNPGTAVAALTRTGESLSSGQPAFPPGTLQHEGSLIYIAPAAVTASEAEELATKAGGKLVVLSTEEKDAWLDDQLASVDGDAGFWIGAKKEDENWQWAGGAPLEFSHWEDEGQATGLGTYAKFVPGAGWRSGFRDDRASGLVVEWPASGSLAAVSSGGGGGFVLPSNEPLSLPPAIVELETKAKNLLAGHDKKRQAELLKNMKDFHWQLDTWLGDLSKNEQAVWANHISLLKARAKDGRVPEKVTGVRLSERMSKVVEYCAAKQATIDTAFKAEAKKIRDAYVTRVSDASSQATAEEKSALNQRLQLSQDLDAWISGIGSVIVAPKSSSASFSILSAIYGTGGKDADVTAKVKKLILDEQRVFRVSPGDLGADPNPGWNKGLTIRYEANGVEGKKSWGENSEVDPVELMKEISSPSQGSASGGGTSNPFGSETAPETSGGMGRFTGNWAWSGDPNNIVEIRENGTAYSRVTKNSAKWVRGLDNDFKITWIDGEYAGRVNTLRLTGENRLEGTDNSGRPLHATRQGTN